MTENTKKLPFIKTVLFLAVYILMMIGATASMLESVGIFRTLPFVFILPAIATIFYNKKGMTAILTFVLVLFFILIEAGSVFVAVITALVAFAFAAVGIFIKRLAVTYFVSDEKKLVILVLAVILFIGCLFSYAFLFGDPFSALSAQKKNLDYIDETYGNSAPEVRYTYYDFDEKTYMTKVSFSEDAVMSADICAADSENIIDGYNNFYEYKYLSARSNILTSLLELKLPDETRAVRINIYETKITSASLKDPDSLCTEMVFDIAFYSQLTSPEEFLEKCREYAKVIRENGFVYGKINYYGGFADEFLFEMTVEYGFDGDLATLVKEFSSNGFERYYEEDDLHDHWSYND